MKTIIEKSMRGAAWIGNDTNNNDNLINSILMARGINSTDEINKFLNPSIKEYMPDPSVLMDMDKCADIITDAIIAKKRIAIYGDYDVDGITSSAVFIKYFREMGADVIWHLPTRQKEGYGLNIPAIDKLKNDGAELIITVDCGTTAMAEVEHANKIGMNIVITDHHSPEEMLPPALAIVNPKRADDTSDLNYLAGVGVAFLTIVAVNRNLRARAPSDDLKTAAGNINLLNYLDLVALGTICDTMPLISLNRAIVATGLKVLGLKNNLGLRILMEIAGVKKPTVYAAGFAIGPRLNAAGRLDSALPALELLLTDNILIAYDLANKLNKMNLDRIEIQNGIMLAAIESADALCKSGKCSLFITGDNWHGGVMGIIAGRLKDKYCLPVCVATKINGVINGSGRSIPGVDLGCIIHDAFTAGIISEGGGHAAAAGFTMMSEKESDFAQFMEKAVLEQLSGVAPVMQIFVDAEIDAGAANMKLVEQLSAMAPFGQGNPEPTIVLSGAVLSYSTTMGGGSHIRGTVNTSSGKPLNFVGFNLVGTKIGDFLLDDANINTKIKMLGKLKENEYNGRITAQFILEDMSV